jgi:transcriptional regulator GlxA family with amidase domain
MHIGYVIFEGITWLDFIGIYDPLSRLLSMKFIPDLTWDICGYNPVNRDNFGLEIKPGFIKNPLKGYDAIIVPGGHGTRHLQHDREFISWLQTAGDKSTKISICTGSLLLGAAGFLKGKKATTNYNEYETLKLYCTEVVHDRIVEDGNVITAGAVSASIDLGLFLCEKWAGPEAAVEIRKKMDYHG